MDRPERSPSDQADAELLDCGYRNGSDRMVILRCCGPEQFYLERVIFPFEILTFHCPPSTEVEVWTHGLGGPELLETLTIEELILESPAATVSGAAAAPGTGGLEDNPWLQAG